MSLPPRRQIELQDLLSRLSDGSLSAEAAHRLNELLHGDPEACELYLDHLTLEAHLRREFGAVRPAAEGLPAFAQVSPPAPAKPNLNPPRKWLPGGLVVRFGVAAALGAIVMLVSLLWLGPVQEPQVNNAKDPEPGSGVTSEWIATLLFTDNCQWDSKERLVEGQRLSAGRLQLERGLAVLRFDGGAAVVLQGPAELDLESRGSARLNAGRLTVRAPEEAAGFTVRTAASDVVDLGTEFAVVVERNGATELHVLEGEVTYSKPGTPQENAELLGAGKAVRYDQTREQEPRVVPLNAPRFSALLSEAKIGPREDLLLAYEGFNYPIGRLPLASADGGSGWVGPWRLTPPGRLPPGDDGNLSIAFGKMTIPWPVQGGRGPMLEAPPEYVSRCRQLAQPVRLDEDGVYFVSVLLRWDAPPPVPPGKNTTMPAVRLVLRNAEKFNSDHVMFNLPAFHRPQIDVRTGAIFTSATTVPRGETQFWVGKIVARQKGEDEIFFRVYHENEKLDRMEPAAWSVKTRGVSTDAKLDLVVLSKFGGSNCWFDEVRIGKSWRAVVPPAALARNPK